MNLIFEARHKDDKRGWYVNSSRVDPNTYSMPTYFAEFCKKLKSLDFVDVGSRELENWTITITMEDLDAE